MLTKEKAALLAVQRYARLALKGRAENPRMWTVAALKAILEDILKEADQGLVSTQMEETNK